MEELLNYLSEKCPKGNIELENQTCELESNLSNENEFSDCDEDLLIQAANEIEEKHRKRKSDGSDNKENKRQKLTSSPKSEGRFICDLCEQHPDFNVVLHGDSRYDFSHYELR